MNYVTEHARHCIHSQLACSESVRDLDYQCTRNLPKNAPQDANGPVCLLLHTEVCQFHEPFPEHLND